MTALQQGDATAQRLVREVTSTINAIESAANEVDNNLRTPGCARATFAALVSSGQISTIELDRIRGGANLLGAAVNLRDTHFLQDLICAGADPNVPVRFGANDVMLPIHLAALRDDLDCVVLLVDGGASVHARLPGKQTTALVIAATAGHSRTVEFLLARGASFGDVNESGKCFLEFAATGLTDVALAALEADPSLIDRVSDVHTFGKAILRSERAEAAILIVKAIERGFDVRSDVDFESVMQMACVRGHIELIRALLRHGAPLSAGALALAARRDLQIVDLLLEHGCLVNSQDEWEISPFLSAVSSGRVDIARRLVAAGADTTFRVTVTARDDSLQDGRNALHFAACSPAAADMVEFLLGLTAADVGVNVRSHSGLTPLLSFVSAGGEDRHYAMTGAVALAACRRLVAAGADPLALDAGGSSALHLAAANWHDAQILQFFLDCGCDATAFDAIGYSPLMWLSGFADAPKVSANARTAAARWFVQRCGSDVLNQVSIPLPSDSPFVQFEVVGKSTLFLACVAGNCELVRFLAHSGADINRRAVTVGGSMHDSPLMVAVRHDHADVVRLLLRLGADTSCRDDLSLTGLAVECCAWLSLCALATHGQRINAAEALAPFCSTAAPDVMCGVSHEQQCLTFLVLLMLDVVARVTSLRGTFCVAACVWGLPVDAGLEPALRTRRFAACQRYFSQLHARLLDQLAPRHMQLVAGRGADICMALQALELPALLMLAIVDESCALAPIVPMHVKWKMITTIKHWRSESVSIAFSIELEP